MSVLYFLLKGYIPIRHRYKCAHGEIDLVVKNKNVIVFVEVKYRKSQSDALESIGPKNKQRVRRAAEHYISSDHFLSKIGDKLSMRFDAVLISPYFKVTHIRNAF